MKQLMLMVLALCVLLVGCAVKNDPRLPLVTAVDGYASTVNVLAEARQAGKIDDATAERIEVYRSLARAALDSWHEAAENGLPTESAALQFNDAVRLLLQERLKVESEKREAGQ